MTLRLYDCLKEPDDLLHRQCHFLFIISSDLCCHKHRLGQKPRPPATAGSTSLHPQFAWQLSQDPWSSVRGPSDSSAPAPSSGSCTQRGALGWFFAWRTCTCMGHG